MQKCTTCAERGDDVLCVLVEHQATKAQVKAKAAAAAAAALAEAQSQQQQQQQQENVLDQKPVGSPVQNQMMDTIATNLLSGSSSTQQQQVTPAPAQSPSSASESVVPEGYAPPSIIIRGVVSPEDVKELFRMYVPPFSSR